MSPALCRRRCVAVTVPPAQFRRRSSAGTVPPALFRRHGTADATLIGLGSLIGAGVFAAFTPAAAAAGSSVLIGLAGYAGIATMGEEDRDPGRTIPRAVSLALAVVGLALFAAGVVLRLMRLRTQRR